MTKAQTLGFFIALLLGLGYIVWLDTGCDTLGGAMTWQGKVCVTNL